MSANHVYWRQHMALLQVPCNRSDMWWQLENEPTVCAYADCRMFKWLPVYNFLVMFVTLAYQAPFERLFGRFIHPDDKGAALIWLLCCHCGVQRMLCCSGQCPAHLPEA